MYERAPESQTLSLILQKFSMQTYSFELSPCKEESTY